MVTKRVVKKSSNSSKNKKNKISRRRTRKVSRKINKRNRKINKKSRSKRNNTKSKRVMKGGFNCNADYVKVAGIDIPAAEDIELGLNGLSISDEMAEIYKPDCAVSSVNHAMV